MICKKTKVRREIKLCFLLLAIALYIHDILVACDRALVASFY